MFEFLGLGTLVRWQSDCFIVQSSHPAAAREVLRPGSCLIAQLVGQLALAQCRVGNQQGSGEMQGQLLPSARPGHPAREEKSERYTCDAEYETRVAATTSVVSC